MIPLWILIVGSISAFATSMTIGANDVANSFATSIGSKVLTLKQAIVIAAIFEFCGAFFMGSHVTDTIRKGIVDVDVFDNDSESLALGMLCASIATGLWLAVATYFKAPVSTTHSTVGAVLGFALVYAGVNAIKWEKIALIVLSWFASPTISGLLSISIFSVIKHYSLRSTRPIKRALQLMPFMVCFTIAVNIFFIIYKGTPELGLKDLDIGKGIGYACIGGAIAGILTFVGIELFIKRNIDNWDKENSKFNKESDRIVIYDVRIEKLFSYLQIFTACLSAFAHGSNDVANGIAPYTTILNIYNEGDLGASSPVPLWVLASGGGGIALGLALFGRGVIDRMGKELADITPSRGFAMELSASLSVVTASRAGVPVSTTHCQVGSIVGTALSDGKKNVDWKILRGIVFSWFITLPITAGFSALLFYLLSFAL
jgi:phosphate/sulfate permease